MVAILKAHVRRSLLQAGFFHVGSSCRSGTAGTSVLVFAARASTVGVKGVSPEHRWRRSYSYVRRWSERGIAALAELTRRSVERSTLASRRSPNVSNSGPFVVSRGSQRGPFRRASAPRGGWDPSSIDGRGDPKVDGNRWFECITKASLVCMGRAAMVATPSFAGRQSLQGSGRVQSGTVGLRVWFGDSSSSLPALRFLWQRWVSVRPSRGARGAGPTWDSS